MEEMLGLQFNQSTQEDLVNINYAENKKALSYDGELMRSATKYGISREDFIKFYVGNELNPNFENFPPFIFFNPRGPRGYLINPWGPRGG